MHNLMKVAALGLALFLGACANDRSVLQGGTSITAPIANPAGPQELAALEGAYNLAANAVLVYRSRPLCTRSSLESLSNICARRSVITSLQAYDRHAYAALLSARVFIRDNPTLSAVSVLSAARRAVSDYQQALAANNVRA